VILSVILRASSRQIVGGAEIGTYLAYGLRLPVDGKSYTPVFSRFLQAKKSIIFDPKSHTNPSYLSIISVLPGLRI